MSKSSLESLGPHHAARGWNDVLVSYHPTRVTVEGLEAIHRLHNEQRALFPNGTVTLGIIGHGIPIPDRNVRSHAARIGRSASAGLRGECIVLRGHPFWVGMGRSAFRAIQLLSDAWHPREVFAGLDEAARWSLERVGREASLAGELVAETEALIARWHAEHGSAERSA